MRMAEMNVVPDPTGNFKGVRHDKLVMAAGLIPQFAFAVHMSQPETVQEAFDLMMEQYGFGFGDGTEWGKVDKDGMYVSKHEEDDDMPPMLRMDVTEDISVYFYQYAIVGITDGTDSLITRMD
jgi:hypothetical protein